MLKDSTAISRSKASARKQFDEVAQGYARASLIDLSKCESRAEGAVAGFPVFWEAVVWLRKVVDSVYILIDEPRAAD